MLGLRLSRTTTHDVATATSRTDMAITLSPIFTFPKDGAVQHDQIAVLRDLLKTRPLEPMA